MPDETFRWVITGAVAISTLCIVMMAIAGIAMYRIMSRVQARVEGIGDRVDPIIDTVNRLTSENAHNVTTVANSMALIASNAKDVSDVARQQAYRFAELGRDFSDRAKAQMARVDAALDHTVDQVQVAGENVKIAVMKPVREASGVFAGVKAAVSTYAANAGRRPVMDPTMQDDEMFI
jgi:methyl-accepting chemotaxis protein